MAVKSLIESSTSSSEEESSSKEDHQLNKRKVEYESEETDEDDSEEEESDESEDSGLKPKSVTKNPTEKAQVEDDCRSGESDSEEEESDELEDSDPKPKSVSKIQTEKVQEEDGDGSEESDSEEEKSEKKSYDRKPVVSNGNKKSQSEMMSPSARSIKNKTDVGDSKKEFFQRLWSLEDEKVLLNSMLQFRLEKGKEVDSSSLEYFCEFLKGKLSFTNKPKCSQVSLKIKALKKKYSVGTHFTSEHDLQMKEIATQVWELDVNNKSLKRKFSMLEEEVGKLKIFSLKKKLKFGDNAEKAEALEEKIRTQKLLEMKQELKRIGLIRETFKLILEGFQK